MGFDMEDIIGEDIYEYVCDIIKGDNHNSISKEIEKLTKIFKDFDKDEMTKEQANILYVFFVAGYAEGLQKAIDMALYDRNIDHFIRDARERRDAVIKLRKEMYEVIDID
jgi:hypothetical protein